MSPVIHIEDLATELQVKACSVRRTVRRLQEQHGFPHALPGLPARFSRHAVDLWFRSNGGRVAAPAAANDMPDAVEEHRAHLERSYGVGR